VTTRTSLQSSLGITWPGFQLILTGVAIAVSTILWLLRNDPDVIRVLVFVFVTGNVTVFGLNLASPLFDQPFPRNWIVYLALLLPIGAAGSLAASLILYWAYPPLDQDMSRWFVSNVGLATLIAFLTGISTYAVQSTRSRLEAEKEQLRREVFKGLQRVQAQESQLQAAFEIQANLLP
jgi:sigma-B regulation protein RsbU (phosphoserine phosphatase)